MVDKKGSRGIISEEAIKLVQSKVSNHDIEEQMVTKDEFDGFNRLTTEETTDVIRKEA